MADLVLEADRGPVRVLTINRPEKRNALNLDVVHALEAALARIRSDDAIRAVVLTGQGEKAFVAGADIAELKARGAHEAHRGFNAALFLAVEELDVPVVAAIRGWALGGGMELAMACDIRIAGESARFGQPELNLGILPAAGGLHRLPVLVGLGVAKDLVLTGRVIDSAEALRIGLVSRVVADDQVLEEAIAAATTIAGMPPLATGLAKRAMNALFRVRPDTAFVLDCAAQGVLFESPEKHARMQAFLDAQAAKKAK
ncbi:MAG: enoyl-CoA hydratase/isomerase family protein [Planctomycetes bacterium]|nr:enoyl-CoA hydratase/isomerase family protein [Planctomycetota bacterium]